MSDLSIPSLFSVARKVALVTGGGTGIGKMIAAALAQNGAKVYIASRKLKVVQEAAAEINACPQTKASGGECIALQADLTDKAKTDALATQIKQREQKLHILVNNAGISWGASLLDFDEKNGWDKLMAVNVKSLFYLTTALLPLLEKDSTNTDPGRVINISSVASYVPTSADPSGNGTYSYNASKAAVNHLTRVLAATLAEKLITVNAIAPGFYPSRMTQHGLDALGDAVAIAQPTGRIGTTEDMAGLALFFCSRASAHITGQVIVSDGGSTLKFVKMVTRSEFAEPPVRIIVDSVIPVQHDPVISVQCNQNPVGCSCGTGDFRIPNLLVQNGCFPTPFQNSNGLDALEHASSHVIVTGKVLLAYEPKLNDPNEGVKPNLEITFVGIEYLDLSTTTDVKSAFTLPPPVTKEFLVLRQTHLGNRG
ncbi:UNVERIFIED_CONTAM: hypothetical protein HDU68_000456 [Siphonaria sp. JEL0065]|nr:hypothetical protein HDU68_000456 [Siphonaria sp. JEL0065]